MTKIKSSIAQDHVFELLCRDCLHDGRVGHELQGIGNTRGWHELIHEKAKERGLQIAIRITPVEAPTDDNT